MTVHQLPSVTQDPATTGRPVLPHASPQANGAAPDFNDRATRVAVQTRIGMAADTIVGPVASLLRNAQTHLDMAEALSDNPRGVLLEEALVEAGAHITVLLERLARA